MLRKAFLEGSFCQSDVVFPCRVFVGRYLGIVDYTSSEAVVVQWAFFFFTAVAVVVTVIVGLTVVLGAVEKQ